MRAASIAPFGAFIRYIDLAGRVPANVFLHGLGRSSVAFAHIAAHHRLRENRSLLVDMLGFGISGKPEDFSYTLDDHAASIVAALEQIDAPPYRLIGHSLGGAVAVLVGARRPDLVAAMVVAEGNLDPGGAGMSLAIAEQSEDEYVREGFARSLEEMCAQARANPESVPAAAVGLQHLASPLAMHRTARALVELTRPTVREQLLALEMPRTFIVGEHTLESDEKPPSAEDGRGLDGTDVRVIRVPDAGHPMMFQNPTGFAAAIADALDG